MQIRSKVATFISRFEKQYIAHNNITVSRSALLHNLHTFAKISNKSVIPVLKSNAYGHGIKLVATALSDEDIPYLAVDGYFEALRIREISPRPVLIMGAIAPANYRNLRYPNFTFSVQDAISIKALAATGKHIKVHLECNTGMNRYGANADEAFQLAKLILRCPNLQLEGIMTHLADATAPNTKNIDVAVTKFDSIIESILNLGASPRWFHVAQSAGAVRVQSKYANAIRLGIGLYGLNPYEAGQKLYSEFVPKLDPALTLSSTITKINELRKGDQVSYGYTYTADKAMKIAVIPFGYYEGLNREVYSNNGIVNIHSTDAQIVGRVCMNHTMIDLADINASVGDTVTIYSSDPLETTAIDNLAKKYHTFNYSMLTSLSSDIRRRLIA